MSVDTQPLPRVRSQAGRPRPGQPDQPGRSHTIVTTHELTDVRDLAGAFPAAAYSRMKHGDLAAVRLLARPLAARLLAEAPEITSTPGPLVLPVAYKAVPPACWYLADAVLDVVNTARLKAGYEPGRLTRVAKDSVTTSDYATASAADRATELARIGFRIDEDLRDATVVVVDDVRVTGLAERAILQALAPAAPCRVVLAYVATVGGDLARTPAIEATLNHTSVRAVSDLADAVARDEFGLTIRFLKRLLQAPAPERAAFLAVCGPDLRRTLVDGVLATGDQFAAHHADALADLRAPIPAPLGPVPA